MFFWGSREFPVLVQPHDTLRTRTTCALRGPPPAPSLSRTGGRLADDRSFGLWGGEHKQAGGVSTVIAGSPRSHVVSLGASLATARARLLPGVTAAGPSRTVGSRRHEPYSLF